MLFGQSNQVYLTCRRLNKSTMNNRHREVFMDGHWNHLFLSVFRITIWREVIDQISLSFQGFLKFQHSKKHKLHVIKRREYHQMIHQSFCISIHIMLLYFDQFYPRHLIRLNMKLHNTRILYQLHPICLQRMIRFVVEVLIRTQ